MCLRQPVVRLLDISGSSTFGGDPYWVGELGQAYISGLHTGSDDRLLGYRSELPRHR